MVRFIKDIARQCPRNPTCFIPDLKGCTLHRELRRYSSGAGKRKVCCRHHIRAVGIGAAVPSGPTDLPFDSISSCCKYVGSIRNRRE